MQSDTIKLLFTYIIAIVIVIGGGIFLFVTIDQERAESTRLAIVGFMGAATAFVFGQESAKQATRAAQSSSSGSSSGSNGTDSTGTPR